MGNLISLIMQILVMIFVLIIIIFLIRQNIALRYERRIGKYSVEPVNSETISVLEGLMLRYKKLVKKLRKYTNKIFPKTCLKYEKYVIYGEDMEAADFVTNKIIISFVLLFLEIIDSIFKWERISLLSVLIVLTFGFYILDIYLVYDRRKRKKSIENDMLRAIIIMNNAFKAGKSTIQAVEIASKELPEPINMEFKKMYCDMKYGLSTEIVFDRFAKRINLEEARYLSSSLTILNKTGGNIINVFSSIEKTLFDKKKLKEELKNSTASSNAVVKILLLVPFIFVAIIYLVSPGYFEPLFSSTIGYIILFIMALMFIAYAYLLQKIIKVRV